MEKLKDYSIRSHMQRHSDWEAALGILKELRADGYEAYFAGGCVRDAILRRGVNDFDIASNVKPDQVMRLFSRVVDIGKEFGTVIVVGEQGEQVEVTSFREDGPYSDGRHPDYIRYSNLFADAGRRDFTCNALYFDPITDQIIDPVGGVKDIQHRQIQTVGLAQERFAEDHLRILRAFRFQSQLGFQLHPQTYQAAVILLPQLQTVAKERIQVELEKLFMGQYFLDLVKEDGLFYVLDQCFFSMSEIQKARLKRYFLDLGFLDGGDQARLMLRLCAVGFVVMQTKRLSEWIFRLRESGWPKVTFEACRWILDSVQQQLDGKAQREPALNNALKVKFWKNLDHTNGAEFFALLTLVCDDQQRTQFINWKNQYLCLVNDKHRLPEPWLNGRKMMALGMEPGPLMGRLLEEAYEKQLLGELPSEESTIHWAQTKISPKEV